MNETNGLLREVGPASLGLPSPLDYCSKSKNEFINDIIHLKGDRFYRQEIVRIMVDEALRSKRDNIAYGTIQTDAGGR